MIVVLGVYRVEPAQKADNESASISRAAKAVRLLGKELANRNVRSDAGPDLGIGATVKNLDAPSPVKTPA
jgi:hypothetical protein